MWTNTHLLSIGPKGTNLYWTIFIQGNAIENVVYKMETILRNPYVSVGSSINVLGPISPKFYETMIQKSHENMYCSYKK